MFISFSNIWISEICNTRFLDSLFLFHTHKHIHTLSQNKDLLPTTELVVVDGVQDTLSQNILCWHTEYFKLEESEKQRCRKDSLTPLHTLKQALRPSCERCPPRRKGAALSQKTEGCRGDSEWTDLASFP